eukprot:CAMPEP_0115546848 /NCGR_PEP_ID=MMETSP0271-20121206/93341_1 /TAXON_ID=71861 /ORGANISM="Scrippsiella trochoidea, Strain CCMP3099" /LENGTH=246 /DNA_ID=CAMNT_0002980259 /DNA_START=17 /DNA_END=759 /DNA_ORIENTATION=+
MISPLSSSTKSLNPMSIILLTTLSAKQSVLISAYAHRKATPLHPPHAPPASPPPPPTSPSIGLRAPPASLPSATAAALHTGKPGVTTFPALPASSLARRMGFQQPSAGSVCSMSAEATAAAVAESMAVVGAAEDGGLCFGVLGFQVQRGRRRRRLRASSPAARTWLLAKQFHTLPTWKAVAASLCRPSQLQGMTHLLETLPPLVAAVWTPRKTPGAPPMAATPPTPSLALGQVQRAKASTARAACV